MFKWCSKIVLSKIQTLFIQIKWFPLKWLANSKSMKFNINNSQNSNAIMLFWSSHNTQQTYTFVSVFFVAAFQCKKHMEKSPTEMNIHFLIELLPNVLYLYNIPGEMQIPAPLYYHLSGSHRTTKAMVTKPLMIVQHCLTTDAPALLFGWLSTFENAFTEKPDFFVSFFFSIFERIFDVPIVCMLKATTCFYILAQ